jgi:hypothetical protein
MAAAHRTLLGTKLFRKGLKTTEKSSEDGPTGTFDRVRFSSSNVEAL